MAARVSSCGDHANRAIRAWTLRPFELGVSSFAVPGGLRTYDGVGRLQNFPAASFHDLAVKATQTEAYLNCQMNWLFTWIIGNDVKIHPQKFQELLDKFSKNGRRVKSIIAELLQTDEYLDAVKSYEEPESLVKAREVFSNCTDCHQNPLSNMRGSQLKLKLYKISGKLDLAHNGKNLTMPPKGHYWSPSDDDIKAVKSWIEAGAPFLKGQAPILNASEIQTILMQTEGEK